MITAMWPADMPSLVHRRGDCLLLPNGNEVENVKPARHAYNASEHATEMFHVVAVNAIIGSVFINPRRRRR